MTSLRFFYCTQSSCFLCFCYVFWSQQRTAKKIMTTFVFMGSIFCFKITIDRNECVGLADDSLSYCSECNRKINKKVGAHFFPTINLLCASWILITIFARKKTARLVFFSVHVSQAIVCLAMCSDDCRDLGWGLEGIFDWGFIWIIITQNN